VGWWWWVEEEWSSQSPEVFVGRQVIIANTDGHRSQRATAACGMGGGEGA
jgi:hypothetical protein